MGVSKLLYDFTTKTLKIAPQCNSDSQMAVNLLDTEFIVMVTDGPASECCRFEITTKKDAHKAIMRYMVCFDAQDQDIQKNRKQYMLNDLNIVEESYYISSDLCSFKIIKVVY
jgi:hypothetical protein